MDYCTRVAAVFTKTIQLRKIAALSPEAGADMLESMSLKSEDIVSNYPKPITATPLHPRRRGIIIGASQGLGAALARRLARDGYILALLAPNLDGLEAVCKEINYEAKEERAHIYVHDVTEYEKFPSFCAGSLPIWVGWTWSRL